MRNLKCFLSLILIFVIFSASTVFAAARASEQIDIYDIDVATIGSGDIAIKFSVTGNGRMSCLGAESIYIYERIGTAWVLADSYDSEDPGMTASNVAKYGTTKYFYGTAGTEYKIDVTIFAKDMNGNSDSRSKTFTITAR